MPNKKDKPKSDESTEIPWKPDETQIRKIELEKPRKSKEKKNET